MELEGFNQLVFSVGSVCVFLLLGALVGTRLERAHYRRIREREARMRDFRVVTLRTLPEDWNVEACSLVTGSVVVSLDYFRSSERQSGNTKSGLPRRASEVESPLIVGKTHFVFRVSLVWFPIDPRWGFVTLVNRGSLAWHPAGRTEGCPNARYRLGSPSPRAGR